MTADFVVIGGGIMGLSLAREIKRRFADAAVLLIEKEPACGLHASGRNSGVLHAGFYYTADSFKARFTRDGNRELTEYCHERGLPVNACGKLVVARDASELAGLDELLRRARANGVALECVSADEARRIEPRVKTHQRALFSPSTSSVDPPAVIAALWADARGQGVEISTGVAYRGRAWECLEILRREASLFARDDFGFRRLAVSELRKYSRRHLVRLAAELVTGVEPQRYRRWGDPGIRAQLFNLRDRKLEMDFRYEGNERSFHVLNAVSPAFTCALPFSRHLVDEMERLFR